MNAQFLVFSSVAAPKPEDGWQAPPGVKGDITLIMIGHYDSDLRKIDGSAEVDPARREAQSAGVHGLTDSLKSRAA